jgi:hypothetical protein
MALYVSPLRVGDRSSPPPAADTIGTETVSDNFNRANQSPIAGNCSTGGGQMQISSNTVIPVTAPSDCDCFYSAWVSGDNQFSQAEITATGTAAGNGPGVLVRRITTVGTKTYYRTVLDESGNYELAKFDAGAFTSLRTGTVSYVAGQKLGLSATGGATTTLKIWYNNVQIGTNVTDSSSPLLTGDPGLSWSGSITAGVTDNWNAGTVP